MKSTSAAGLKSKLLDRFFSLEEIAEVALAFGPWLRAPICICFSGPLGAGKTTLIGEILHRCGDLPRAAITSPTFTMLHEYDTSPPFSHFDLYRLTDPVEFERMGWDEHFDRVALVEWSERLEGRLPDMHLEVELSIEGESRRRVQVYEIA